MVNVSRFARYAVIGSLCSFAGVSLGCGGSPSNPTSPATPAAPTVTSLTISGQSALGAVGETSQLTATAGLSDGTTQNYSTLVQWSSTNTSVATISAGGLLTARALGLATIQASVTSKLRQFVNVVITPPGTFILAGRAREPGAESLGGVRVLHAASGQTLLTTSDDFTGGYLFSVAAGRRLSFTKAGYEDVDFDGTPNVLGDAPMQQVVRLEAGAQIGQTLVPNDMDYLVSPTTSCQPCRLIRITGTTTGTVRVRVTWTDPFEVLNVWLNGRVFPGSAITREAVADLPFVGSEIVVYVGMVKGTSSSYYEYAPIPFILSTTRPGAPLF